MSHDSTILLLVAAVFAIGGLRGAFPHYREHRRIRREELAHRRLMWLSMRDRGYDVTPWETARKTGQLLTDRPFNELLCELEERKLHEARHD